MQQVAEKTGIRGAEPPKGVGPRHAMVRCTILMVNIAISVACEPKHPQTPLLQQTNASASNANGERILRRGLPGEPRTLDPQLADDDFSFQVIRDLYEGLTMEDRLGQIVPGTASSWAIDRSGTVYEFELRSDAKWSNGQAIVADDFVRGLRRAIDPRTASGSAANLRIIKGASEIIAGRAPPSSLAVQADGQSKVRISLEHPAPYLLQILAQPIAAPRFVDNQAPQDSAVHHYQPPVNGPYVLARRLPGSLIELTRNPFYWSSNSVDINSVRYQIEESESTELREYLADQLDLTFTIPAPDFPRIQEMKAAEVQTAPVLWTMYLALNLAEPPLRGSKDVRQALSMAVDREMIAKYVAPGVTPAYSFVAKGVTGYDRPEYPWSLWSREMRLEAARSLMSRAGYSSHHPLHLRLYFNSGEGIRRVMVAIASNWKQDLGVDSKLVSDEFRVFLDSRHDHRLWDVARLGWSADYDDPANFLENFSDGNAQNDPDYRSAEFNRYLSDARETSDANERLRVLRRAEQSLLNDYPIIPIYFYQARRLVKPYLGGAHITPMNRTYTKDLYWQTPSNPITK